jgi:hypothetical protein
MENIMRSYGIDAGKYREHLQSLICASNPDMKKKFEEVIEQHINRWVWRFFVEAQLEGVASVGGYIQIGQKGLEWQVPFVSPDEGYA